MEHKDLFSSHSKIYAAFRPSYPKALYDFILPHVHQRDLAWDCATGNGQVAVELAEHFRQVYATDISKQQLEEAIRKKNIVYSIGAAEKTSFADGQFDLITVGQAMHWFNLEKFYSEVSRVARPGCILACWGYSLATTTPEIDALFRTFYHEEVGAYWDPSRKLVDDHYRNIPFPFETIPSPEFEIAVGWSQGQFAGYLTSWSATQKFIRQNGHNPVDRFMKKINSWWKPAEIKPVRFPVFLRLGRIAG